MATVQLPYTQLAQIMSNVEKLRASITRFEQTDPMHGKEWKDGMISYYQGKLVEAEARARDILISLGLDPDEALAYSD